MGLLLHATRSPGPDYRRAHATTAETCEQNLERESIPPNHSLQRTRPGRGFRSIIGLPGR